MGMSEKPRIAIATGDPGGIGPEISIKAALDPAVCAACKPIVVSDQAMLAQHANACGIKAELRVVAQIADADWSGPWLNVLDCPQPGAVDVAFGTSSADGGHAAIAFARVAIKAAIGGAVDAVVAAPQNETSIALAGIKFDGHPSFVARETGTDENDVYLMLCFDRTRIVHCTLHQSVKTAIAMITRERVLGVLTAAQRALEQLGIAAPKIAVSGLNPHSGECGLFGREEIESITPAIEMAIAQGIAAAGPFGADILFHKSGFDAYVVMLHDQGHIAAKLLAPSSAAALTIGDSDPVLFRGAWQRARHRRQGHRQSRGHGKRVAAALECQKDARSREDDGLEPRTSNGMPSKIELCNISDIATGAALRVERDDLILAVFNVGGEFFVTDDACTHGPGSLSEGYIEDDIVECNFHNGQFNIKTGEVVSPPCMVPVKTYRTFVEDGKVFIEV